jgi:hypothetical protein
MRVDNGDNDYLRRLAEGIRQYRTRLSDAEERSTKAKEAVEDARDQLAAAERFYKMELKRLGHKEEQVQLPLNREARFLGMPPKEACVTLLKEHGTMTLDQLEAELKAGGFKFKGSPKRTINMALMGRANVERVPGGTFRYRGKGS